MARSRQTTVPASSQYVDASSTRGALYEPLAYPLDSQRKIGVQQLARSNEFAELDNLLKAAATTLSECVLEINELAAARAAQSQPPSQPQASTNDDVSVFLNDVKETSAQIEKSVRATIDEMREVQNLRAALKTVDEVHVQGNQARLLRQRPATQSDGVVALDDDDDDMLGTEITAPGATAHESVGSGPGPGPKAVFEEALKAERQKYDLITMHNRYAEMPQYIEFKRHEWEGKHSGLPEDETPQLPHSRHWFTERGSPAPGAAPSADDSDDDIQTLKVKISTKCPLTYKEMQEPVCNRKCQHVYEREALEHHIRTTIGAAGRGAARNTGAECAVPGCDKVIGLKDLFVDKLMTRKIERVRAARQADSEAAVHGLDVEDVDGDGFNAVDEDESEDEQVSDDAGTQNRQSRRRSTLPPKSEPRSSRR